jgi:hypothetical protein
MLAANGKVAERVVAMFSVWHLRSLFTERLLKKTR